MEDELILADLGVAERRLERLEKDLKKSRTAELERERDVVTAVPDGAREGTPLRALDLKGDDLKRLRGFQFLSAKPLLIVINWTKRSSPAAAQGATRDRSRGGRRRPQPFLSRAATAAVAVCAKIELEIAQLDAADAAAFLADLRPDRIGPRPRHSRQLRSARLHFVLHGRRRRVPRLVDSARHARRSSRPARFTATSRAASFARKWSAYDASDRARLDGRVPRSRRSPARRQGVRRSGRRHHQLPLRDMMANRSSSCEAQVPFVHGGAELHVRRLVAELRRARLSRRARVGPVQVVPEGSSCSRMRPRGAWSTFPKATASRSTPSSRRSSRPISCGIRTRSPGCSISTAPSTTSAARRTASSITAKPTSGCATS